MLVELLNFCKKKTLEGHKNLEVTLSIRGQSYGKFYPYLVANVTSDDYLYYPFQNETVEKPETIYDYGIICNIYKSILVTNGISVNVVELYDGIYSDYKEHKIEQSMYELLATERIRETIDWCWSKIWAIEMKLKNPKFMEKVRRMNPNGIVKETAKGKELLSIMSDIDAIKRMIKNN